MQATTFRHKQTLAVSKSSSQRLYVTLRPQRTFQGTRSSDLQFQEKWQQQTSAAAPRLSHVTKASSSGASAADSHAGHAILHDFCMTIPYGCLAVLGGIVCAFLGPAAKVLALPMAGAGLTAVACSVLSLKKWKQGLGTAPFTLAAAGASGGAGYMAYTTIPQLTSTATIWLGWILVALSAACSLFCVYNVIAGGNPPRKGSH